MNETHHEAWRRRNGLLPLERQEPHQKLTGYSTKRTLLDKPEARTAFRLHWERTWMERWELRGDGKYYPKEKR